MIRRPPRSTLSSSSAASDVYKRQVVGNAEQHESVGGLERLIGAQRLVPRARFGRLRAFFPVALQEVREEREGCVEEGGLDECALPRLLAVEQRGQDSRHRVKARRLVHGRKR